jgi:four helix bundle protein
MPKNNPVDVQNQRLSEVQCPVKIRDRAFAFSLRAIKLFQHLQKQKNGAGWVIGRQFLRAACSVGANVEEAQSAESRADFVHKLGIAQKEARETLYWLRLLGESQIIAKTKLGPLLREAEILIRVLGAIILTTKNGRKASNHARNTLNSEL